MPDSDHLALFIAAGLLLNITPGPDVMFIVSHAMRSGLKAGAVAAIGISAGCFVHIVAAALGVSALLATSTTAFTVLKSVGAVYLFYVGASMLRSNRHDASQLIAVDDCPTKGAAKFTLKMCFFRVLQRMRSIRRSHCFSWLLCRSSLRPRRRTRPWRSCCWASSSTSTGCRSTWAGPGPRSGHANAWVPCAPGLTAPPVGSTESPAPCLSASV